MVLLYLGFGLVSIAMHFWWHPFMAFVGALPLCKEIPWHQGIAIAFSLLFLLDVVLLSRASAKIFRYGQTPPPDAWVWGRRRIRRGWRATIAGYLTIAYALAFAAALIWGWVYLKLWLLFRSLPQCAGA